jgi:hypothetical protein
MFEGKEFLWCKNHLRWGRHPTAKCKKGPASTRKDQTNPSPTTSSNTTNRTLTIAESLQAIAEEEEEE